MFYKFLNLLLFLTYFFGAKGALICCKKDENTQGKCRENKGPDTCSYLRNQHSDYFNKLEKTPADQASNPVKFPPVPKYDIPDQSIESLAAGKSSTKGDSHGADQGMQIIMFHVPKYDEECKIKKVNDACGPVTVPPPQVVPSFPKDKDAETAEQIKPWQNQPKNKLSATELRIANRLDETMKHEIKEKIMINWEEDNEHWKDIGKKIWENLLALWSGDIKINLSRVEVETGSTIREGHDYPMIAVVAVSFLSGCAFILVLQHLLRSRHKHVYTSVSHEPLVDDEI